jgi:hypothetical protein
VNRRYAEHSERILARIRELHALNPDKARTRRRKWTQRNPERIKAYTAKQIAKQKAKLAEAERIIAQVGPAKPKRKPGRKREALHDRSFFKIGRLVENLIPVELENDRHAIVDARRKVSHKTGLDYDLVAEYHKEYRKVLRNNPGLKSNA